MAKCVTSAKMPRYSEKKGWHGGDSRTLYTFTDERTGQKHVRPGDAMRGVGPAGTVRLATRAEALRFWQNPLHAGWKVSCPVGLRRRLKR